MWNNFNNQHKNLGDISPYFLSNYLLDYLNLDKPLKFKFMNLAYKKICALKENLCIDKNGNMNNVIKDRESENMFFNLEYDSIFGHDFLSLLEQ